MNKPKEYTVYLDTKVSIGVKVRAESFEEALAEGRKYTVPDLLHLAYTEDEYLDFDAFKVTGVFA